MCGRFSQGFSGRDLWEFFQLAGESWDFHPRYNVAPGQDIAVLRWQQDGRRFGLLRWGLIPHWAKQEKGAALINARAETAHQKPSFRAAFATRRCLIPATGFFEWQRRGDIKQPYFIRLKNGELCAFAGLWETWQGPHGAIPGCAILTTRANEMVTPIHERMPVLLPAAHFDPWLRGENVPLDPFPAAQMQANPVSTLVNNPTNETPGVVASG